MSYLYLSLILLLFGGSCKFHSSPYVVDVPKLELNTVNLQNILRSPTTGDFKIAILSDTHNYYEELERAVKHINRNGPFAFVVITGDITNLGLAEEFQQARRYFNRLNYPYLVVVGNHDLLSNGDRIFDRLFGLDDFSFDYGGVRFIAFNNNNWETAGRVPDFDWVDSELSQSAGQRKILLAHVPLDDRDRFSIAEIERWDNLVLGHTVDYVVNGHNHNPGTGTFGGATTITVGSPAKRSYYEIRSEAGVLSHRQITF